MAVTRAQRALLERIAQGKIADRYHLRCGWATRDMGRYSRGPGGGMGANVTAAARRLRELGLAEPVAQPNRYDDQPWRVTPAGPSVLRS